MRYDVIIEAGFAGCALAIRLSEDPSRSVLFQGWGQIIRSSTASPRTSSERCHRWRPEKRRIDRESSS
jgi:choline dehydrogenase-like flavoprotein